jgi:modification methylase
MTAREAPRVAFSALVERGLVSAGAKLVDAKRRHAALVRADGAVALIAKSGISDVGIGDKVGSIHRIGALAQGLEACNGWSFWHVETPKGLVSIDMLRAEFRAEKGAA